MWGLSTKRAIGFFVVYAPTFHYRNGTADPLT